MPGAPASGVPLGHGGLKDMAEVLLGKGALVLGAGVLVLGASGLKLLLLKGGGAVLMPGALAGALEG